MDTLPQELVNRIASFVERREGEAQAFYHERKKLPANLPPLATLSRTWKEAIETISFRTLDIKSKDLYDFQTIVSGIRREKVKQIAFSTVLPTYSDEDCGRLETIGDQIANDESFSQSLKQLFNILKAWEDDGVKGTIMLHMSEVYSPMDPHKREKPLHDYRMEVIQRKRIDIFEKRYEGSYIQLVEPEQLPILSRVSSITTSRFGQRAYAPCTAVRISSRILNLESIGWDLVDLDDLIPDEADSLDEIGTPECTDELDRNGQHTSSRRGRRNDLTEALNANSLRSVKEAFIELYHEPPEDQSREIQSLLPRDFSFDPLSAALRLLSENLTSFTLKATIDPSLFWPLSENDAPAPVAWPSLKNYIVTFDMTTPSGTWYFTGIPAPQTTPPSSPRSDRSEVRNIFRTSPDSELIDPLLLSFGEATQRMPVLELATLTCPLLDEESNAFQFEVSYQAPGKPSFYGDENEEDARSRRVYYEVGDWRPSVEVAQALRGIGEERHGGRAIERFLGRQF